MRFRRLRLFSLLLLGSGLLAAALAAPEAADAPASDTRPVQVAGLWCGTGLLHEFRFELSQQEHQVHGNLMRRDRARTVEGRLDGSTLRTESTKVGSLVLELEGNELRITGGEGPLSLLRGSTFQRATGGTCAG